MALLVVPGLAAALHVDRTDMERQLDSLRLELGKLERQIESGRAREIDILNSLNTREREAALAAELIRGHQRDLRVLRDSIATLENSLPKLETQLSEIQESIRDTENRRQPMSTALARSLLASHRLDRWAALEFLLGADSWRDLLARRSIVTRLQRSALRVQRGLAAELSALDRARESVDRSTQRARELRESLVLKRREQEDLLGRLNREQRALQANRDALRRDLRTVRANRDLLELHREQSSRALDAIRDMVASLEQGVPITGVPLNLLKGRLPWPVEGEVLRPFGRVRNPELATVTDNPGIDLGTQADAPVRAVAAGRVSSVTWLRGFGNVCIVEHPGSYYSVYAQLGQVSVQAEDVVTEEDVLGYPSFDPMQEQYRVHFEIWDRREKQNPMVWLRRK